MERQRTNNTHQNRTSGSLFLDFTIRIRNMDAQERGCETGGRLLRCGVEGECWRPLDGNTEQMKAPERKSTTRNRLRTLYAGRSLNCSDTSVGYWTNVFTRQCCLWWYDNETGEGHMIGDVQVYCCSAVQEATMFAVDRDQWKKLVASHNASNWPRKKMKIMSIISSCQDPTTYFKYCVVRTLLLTTLTALSGPYYLLHMLRSSDIQYTIVY